MSSTSSVIATAKIPSASASMRCLDKPTGSKALTLRRVMLPPMSSCANGDRACTEAVGESIERDSHAVDLEVEHGQRSAAAAMRDDVAMLDRQRRRTDSRGSAIENPCAQETRRPAVERRARTRVRRRNRAHEIVNFGGALRPVDDA